MKKYLSLLCVAILIFYVGILWLYAQPISPRGKEPKAKHGMDYMNQASKNVMTGGESKKALLDKAKEGDGQTISLELRNINIVDILKILSQTGGINIVAGPSVRGNTTIFLEDVNVWDALRIILEINRLAYIQDGDILKVITEKEYEQMYGVPFHNTAQTKVFKLKHARVDDVTSALNSIKSTKGKIIVDERTNTLIVIDTPDAMKGVIEVIGELDVLVATRIYQLKYTTPDIIEDIAKDIITKKGFMQVDPLTNKIIITDTVESLDFIDTIIKEYDQKPFTETRTIYLSFASYEDIEPKIKDLLTKEVGLVITDKRTNALVITDYPDKIDDIVEIIKTLDTIHKQVMIDCKIVNVILNDDFAMGIDFEKLFAGGHSSRGIGYEQQFGTVSSDGLAFPIPGAATTGEITSGNVRGFNSTGSGTGSVFTFGREDQVRTAIRMLKRVGKTKLLSEPRITVMNNEEAQIQVGTDEPFVTSSTTVNSSTSSTAEDIQFIDVGVLLSVTPTINDTGYITMKIKPEVSQVARTVLTSKSNTIPVVQTSELETTVMVKNRTTIVLGGLIRETRSKSVSKMPIIGSIPILGIPFRSTQTRVRQEELLIFLTPTILSGEKDMLASEDSRAFSREFLYGIDRLEKMSEDKYKKYLRDQKIEDKTDAIKKDAKYLKEQRKKENKYQKKRKKLFFGIF